MKPTTLFALALLLPSPALFAQAETVGLTNTSPFVVRQVQDGGNCATRSCQLAPHQSQVAVFAGGTAFDGRLNAVWSSNGTLLDTSVVPDGTTRGCRLVCRQQRVPQAPNGLTRYTTGMCYLEAGTLTSAGAPGPFGRIYFAYNTPVIGWADARGCTLLNYKFCRLPFLPATARIGGLACDDINRFLFIGTWDTAGGAIVYVVRADDPCTAICKVQITVSRQFCRAPLGSMAGLAYDGCTQMLYVTDGRQTVSGQLTVSPSGACRWVGRTCCPAGSEPYTGLAMLPRPARTVGRACTSGRCSSCPTMAATMTGAPVVGNPQFRLNLVNAPSNSTIAVLAVGLGPCTAPGLSLGFCNNITVSTSAPGPIINFLPLTSLGGGCTRAVSVPFPLPVNRALCNFRVSFQWVVACRAGGGIGDGVTPCVDFPISGT